MKGTPNIRDVRVFPGKYYAVGKSKGTQLFLYSGPDPATSSTSTNSMSTQITCPRYPMYHSPTVSKDVIQDIIIISHVSLRIRKHRRSRIKGITGFKEVAPLSHFTFRPLSVLEAMVQVCSSRLQRREKNWT